MCKVKSKSLRIKIHIHVHRTRKRYSANAYMFTSSEDSKEGVKNKGGYEVEEINNNDMSSGEYVRIKEIGGVSAWVEQQTG